MYDRSIKFSEVHYKVYWVIKDVYMNEDNCKYVSYGIATDDYSIGDVSTVQEYVEELVHLCNKYNLSKEHLADVVEDSIIE